PDQGPAGGLAGLRHVQAGLQREDFHAAAAPGQHRFVRRVRRGPQLHLEARGTGAGERLRLLRRTGEGLHRQRLPRGHERGRVDSGARGSVDRRLRRQDPGAAPRRQLLGAVRPSRGHPDRPLQGHRHIEGRRRPAPVAHPGLALRRRVPPGTGVRLPAGGKRQHRGIRLDRRRLLTHRIRLSVQVAASRGWRVRRSRRPSTRRSQQCTPTPPSAARSSWAQSRSPWAWLSPRPHKPRRPATAGYSIQPLASGCRTTRSAKVKATPTVTRSPLAMQAVPPTVRTTMPAAIGRLHSARSTLRKATTATRSATPTPPKARTATRSANTTPPSATSAPPSGAGTSPAARTAPRSETAIPPAARGAALLVASTAPPAPTAMHSATTTKSPPSPARRSVPTTTFQASTGTPSVPPTTPRVPTATPSAATTTHWATVRLPSELQTLPRPTAVSPWVPATPFRSTPS